MKLKILLLTVFAAGLSASLAFADGGRHKDKGPGSTCTPVHLEGTVAPQSLTMVVTHSGEGGTIAAGSTVTLAVGTTGQTVRVNVEACSSGGSLTVKHLELQPMKPKSDGTTTGEDHHGDKTTTTSTTGGDDNDQGEHHKGGTTTTTTTATTTTTSSTTTATTP